LHLRVLGERGRGAGQYAPADLQHRGKIGNFEREFDRLRYRKRLGRALAAY
jgi:hypothetical protein